MKKLRGRRKGKEGRKREGRGGEGRKAKLKREPRD
jgi:hypothetical protein